VTISDIQSAFDEFHDDELAAPLLIRSPMPVFVVPTGPASMDTFSD
jgi:hypothetical protein